MVNYYELLNINQSLSIDEINEALDKLENTWNRRIINEPEKANEMLELINNAKETFVSNEEREKYDKSLEAGCDDTSENTLMTEYILQILKTQTFIDDEQWDIAKNSIDKAIILGEQAELTDEQYIGLYNCATNIYIKNNRLPESLEFVNKCIEIDSNNAQTYARKAIILNDILLGLNGSGVNTEGYKKQYKTACKMWVKYAKIQGDNQLASSGLDALARTYISGEEQNYPLVAQYEKEAISLNPNNTGAQQVLDFLDKPIRVDYGELRFYSDESCIYENEIKELINILISGKIKPANGVAYEIANKLLYCEYDKSYGEHNFERRYYISLNMNGTFKMRVDTTSSDYYYKLGSAPPDIKRESETSDISLNTVMIEMDFEGHAYNRSEGVLEHLTYVSEFSPNHYNEIELCRINAWKGFGLYKKLKEIVEEEEKRKVEDEAKRKTEEEERKRRAEEDERKRKAEEEAERKRKEAEAERKRKEAEAERKRKEAEEEAYQRRQTWKSQGRCMHCGGNFKGLLTKKCVNCGREKDY